MRRTLLRNLQKQKYSNKNIIFCGAIIKNKNMKFGEKFKICRVLHKNKKIIINNYANNNKNYYFSLFLLVLFCNRSLCDVILPFRRLVL